MQDPLKCQQRIWPPKQSIQIDKCQVWSVLVVFLRNFSLVTDFLFPFTPKQTFKFYKFYLIRSSVSLLAVLHP